MKKNTQIKTLEKIKDLMVENDVIVVHQNVFAKIAEHMEKAK